MKYKDAACQMAVHAYYSVPLCHRIAEESGIDVTKISFEDFPIVDKSHYRGAGMSCLSFGYIGDYLVKKLRWTRTSDSTGNFTEVYWKPEEEKRSLLPLWMDCKGYYGISTADRMYYFFV